MSIHQSDEGVTPATISVEFFPKPSLAFFGTDGIIANVTDAVDASIDHLNEVDAAILEALARVVVARIERRKAKETR